MIVYLRALLEVYLYSLLTFNTKYSYRFSYFSAAIENKVKRIVYCSSMARYGTNKIPFKEEYPSPQDPYGIAKVVNILKFM